MASPTRATKIKNVITNVDHNKFNITYTADEALAFLIENKLTEQKYLNIRLGAKKKYCDIYQTYANILEAKKKKNVIQIICMFPNQNVRFLCKTPLTTQFTKFLNRISQVRRIKFEQ